MAGFDNQKSRCPVPVGVSLVESPASHTYERKLSDLKFLFDHIYLHHPDWLTYNPSCPNGICTEIERFQKTQMLNSVLVALADMSREKSHQIGFHIPLLIKLGPDMQAGELRSTIETVLSSGLVGVISSNTTTDRENKYGHINNPRPYGRGFISLSDFVRSMTLHPHDLMIGVLRVVIKQGGISGPILYPKSLAMVREIRTIEREYFAKNGKTRSKLVIIGCGGIDSGAKVTEMKQAGADLIQVLSGFVFGGPYFFSKLKRETQ